MRGGAVSITDVLDLLGLLLVVASVGLLVGGLAGVWAGLGAGGLGLLAISWLLDARQRAAAKRGDA